MRMPLHRAISMPLLTSLVLASCKPSADKAAGGLSVAAPGTVPMSMVKVADIPPDADYTAADVEFMQGMIYHHGQALVMTGMAASHGANPRLAILCQRMYIAQEQEIDLMQNWLRDRHQPVPDAKDPHPMMMDGMLTPAQITELGAAKDTAWDRLFLTGMIHHHEGAIKMVADLFAAPQGGQQADVLALASGIDAGQRVEIGIMEGMLNKSTTPEF
jgi:uncharacterized protein (DUF305 family)